MKRPLVDRVMELLACPREEAEALLRLALGISYACANMPDAPKKDALSVE